MQDLSQKLHSCNVMPDECNQCSHSTFHSLSFYNLTIVLSKCKFIHSLAIQLWRHGDRSPVSTFPTNPVNLTAWPQGLGQLTQVSIAKLSILCLFPLSASCLSSQSHVALYPQQGMRQHYELGQKLRQRYILGQPYKLLSSNYSRVEVSPLESLPRPVG